jgi:hypothetical protein
VNLSWDDVENELKQILIVSRGRQK